MRSRVPHARSDRNGPQSGPVSTQRRRFLAGATSLAAAAVAGCLDRGSDGSGGTQAAFEPSEGWPTYRGDRQRTGRAPAEAGPGESLSVAWETSVYDLIEMRENVSAERPAEADDEPAATGYCSDVTLTDDLALCSVYYQLHEEETDGTSWGGVVALDAAGGSIEWTIPGTPAIMQAPSVAAGKLYLGVIYPMTADTDEPHVLVADATSGDVVHRHAHPGMTRGAPTFTENSTYLMAPNGADYALEAMDPSDGTQRWTVDPPTPTADGQPLAVHDGSLLYAGHTDDDSIDLVSLATDSGDVQWRQTPERESHPSYAAPETLGMPALVGDSGYVAGPFDGYWRDDVYGGPLHAFAVDSGQTQWQFRPEPAPYNEILGGQDAVDFCKDDESCEEPEYAALHGTPLPIDGQVVVGGVGRPAQSGESHEKHRHLYAVDGSNGSLEWSVPGATASAVAAGDVIYATMTDGRVQAMSTDGTVLDSVETDAGASRSKAPAIGHGRLYAQWGSNGNSLHSPDTVAAIE